MKPTLKISVILFVGIFLMFSYPYFFSNIYDVPLWFLWPKLIPLSVVQIEKTFVIRVEPEVPIYLGETIKIQVTDSNNTCIDDVKVEIMKNGDKIIELYTDDYGKVSFEYLGEITIIRLSKDWYKSEYKVIPRIPDNWIRASNQNNIATLISMSLLIITSIGIVVQNRDKYVSLQNINLKKSIIQVLLSILLIGSFFYIMNHIFTLDEENRIDYIPILLVVIIGLPFIYGLIRHYKLSKKQLKLDDWLK